MIGLSGGVDLPAERLAALVSEPFIPISAEEPRNAARFAQLGVGLTIERSELTAQSIRDAVSEVLDNPSYRNAALGIRQEMQALPGPEHAAELLTRLVRDIRPGTEGGLE